MASPHYPVEVELGKSGEKCIEFGCGSISIRVETSERRNHRDISIKYDFSDIDIVTDGLAIPNVKCALRDVQFVFTVAGWDCKTQRPANQADLDRTVGTLDEKLVSTEGALGAGVPEVAGLRKSRKTERQENSTDVRKARYDYVKPINGLQDKYGWKFVVKQGKHLDYSEPYYLKAGVMRKLESGGDIVLKVDKFIHGHNVVVTQIASDGSARKMSFLDRVLAKFAKIDDHLHVRVCDAL
jgi:hypothetical protein